MFTLVVTEQGGTERRQQFDKNEITIGRVTSNDVVLPKGNISKRHSRIIKRDGSFIVVDIKSTNGTFLNGRRINSPERVNPGDKIYIGEFRLSIEADDQTGDQSAQPARVPQLEVQGGPPPLRPPSGPTSFEGQPAVQPPGPPPMAPAAPPPGPPPMASRPPSLPQGSPPDLTPPPQPSAPPPLAPPQAAPSAPPAAPPVVSSPVAAAPPVAPPPQAAPSAPPRAPTVPPPPQASPAPSPSVPPPPVAPLDPLADEPTPPPSMLPAAPARPQRAQPKPNPKPAPTGIGAELCELIDRLPSDLDAFTTSAEALQDDGRRQAIEHALSGEKDALVYAAKAELTGLGAFEALMADSEVQAIFADQQSIRVDRGQGVETSGAVVSSPKMLSAIAGRLLSGAGLEGASGTFSIAGFSVRAIRPPAASSAMIAMTRVLEANELVATGVLTSDQADTLDQAVKDGKHILVIGSRRNTDRLLGLFDGAGVDLDVGHGAVMSSYEARGVAVSQAQAYHDVVVVSGAAPGELAMLAGASVIGVTAKNLFAVRAVLGALGQMDIIGAFDLAVELDTSGRVTNINKL